MRRSAKPHDPEPDFSRPERRDFNLLERIMIPVDDIVQEPDRQPEWLSPASMVDDGAGRPGRTNLDTLIEPRGAGFIRQEQLLSAGVVASMSPKRGVGLSALIWSRKITPDLP